MGASILTTKRKYNDGEWTEARFNSFVKGGLRSASQRWPPKYRVLSQACVGTKLNVATGRMAKHYICNSCKNEFPAKNVEVNHIRPVVPVTGFDSWDGVVERLFCEAEGLEVVCKLCHRAITKQENIIRKIK
jgi:hypothetical protein